MKRTSFKISLIIGLIAFLYEYRSIKGETYLNIEWLFGIFIKTLLVSITIKCIINDAQLFRKQKKVINFLPSFSSIFFLSLTLGHIAYVYSVKKNESLFKAITYQINDEGFYLDFKKDGHVIGELPTLFNSKHYFGTYRQKGDTIFLHLKTNIGLGQTGILKDDKLVIVNGNLSFNVSKY